MAKKRGSVSAEKQRNGSVRFRARSYVGSKRSSLGLFDTRDEALRAVEDARRAASGKPAREIVKRSSGFVYAARCHALGVVKIGWASDVAKRVKVIDAHSPAPVVLEWSAPGSLADEIRLHRLAERHRARGEWFALTHDEFLALLASWRPTTGQQPSERPALSDEST